MRAFTDWCNTPYDTEGQMFCIVVPISELTEHGDKTLADIGLEILGEDRARALVTGCLLRSFTTDAAF